MSGEIETYMIAEGIIDDDTCEDCLESIHNCICGELQFPQENFEYLDEVQGFHIFRR